MYGTYLNFYVTNAEGEPDIAIPSGKIGTVTFDIPSDMQSPLNFTFGIYDDENLVYAASAISGSHDDFSFDATNTSVTNPQPITITTVKLGPIANLRKSYDYVEDAYDTIETKGGTIPTDKNLANLSDAIDSISGGGGVRVDEDDDVLFIDYDGSIVCSYSAEDFLELTEMPANPTHEGLVSQGWNWSLADAKQYVTNHGMIDIGQMYATESGASEFDIELTSKTGKEVSLYFNSYTTATIDWGDNTTPEAINDQTMAHTYTNYGEYTIKVSGDYTFGMVFFEGGEPSGKPMRICKAVRIANNVTSLSLGMFYYCTDIKYITLPSSLTLIDGVCFAATYSLISLTIPNGITTIDGSDDYYGIMISCYSLKYISIPNSVLNLGHKNFELAYDLKRLCIPDSVTTIYGSNFEKNIQLEKLSIGYGINNIPASSFNFDNRYGKNAIKKLKLKDNVNIELINNNLVNWDILQYCEEVDLGNNITVYKGLMFDETLYLKKVKFPSNISELQYNCFAQCENVRELDFRDALQVPTLSGNIGITIDTSNEPSPMKIIVPDALYDQWIVATNWVNYVDFIYRASEV